MYKIVCSDPDGTLLDENMNVSHENLDAIAKMDEKCVLFVPSSGRTLSETPKALRIILTYVTLSIRSGL